MGLFRKSRAKSPTSGENNASGRSAKSPPASGRSSAAKSPVKAKSGRLPKLDTPAAIAKELTSIRKELEAIRKDALKLQKKGKK